MYCDDSRVTQVEAKEVVVSLQYHLLPFARAHIARSIGEARLHLILQESQNINYTFIYLPIFPSRLLACSLSPTLHPCHRVVYYSTPTTIQPAYA